MERIAAGSGASGAADSDIVGTSAYFPLDSEIASTAAGVRVCDNLPVLVLEFAEGVGIAGRFNCQHCQRGDDHTKVVDVAFNPQGSLRAAVRAYGRRRVSSVAVHISLADRDRKLRRGGRRHVVSASRDQR